ncbi:MAG: UDP-N-acetylmuramoyl-L-alanyl-D-glutamate--2,6-diaminopimelate ligase [Patescibacteria group bacterium]|nr:UDP-N-acetylmuramoyl-L-alanyl-D-glutamate--2,6-diaminopimelate ligase [Patescibacteria group bacterium]
MIKKWLKKLIPRFFLNQYYFLLAFFGAVFYGFPSQKLKVVGITGTNGKSTVVSLSTKILEGAGYKVASISSIKFKINGKEWINDFKMTMPGRFRLQKFLKQAVRAGCEYALIEVTSEGIKQYRHRFIHFDVAVFTNLSPEHIEAHKGFEKYRQEKLKLFKCASNLHIINLDDKSAEYFLKIPAKEKYCYTIEKRKTRAQSSKNLKAENIKTKASGVNFEVCGTLFHLNLLGKFNIYNSLAAVCVGLSQGVSLKICKKALEKVKVIPGRMEVIADKPFEIIVDYAHTPDSLEKVYQAIKKSKFKTQNLKQISNTKIQKPNMICVLGACGGGRDKWKRPVFGEIAAKHCDKIIITNEDPYDENPSKILSGIKSGIFNFSARNALHNDAGGQFPISNFYEILDRRNAIKKALELAQPNDIVIITGKGSEPWMCVEKGKKIPWNDRKIVHQELKKQKLITNH